MFIVIGKRRVKVCYKIRSRSDYSGLFFILFFRLAEIASALIGCLFYSD